MQVLLLNFVQFCLHASGAKMIYILPAKDY